MSLDIFGKLFGSKKVVDGIYNGLDATFYTNEEKAERFAEYLKLYEPFKIAQRYLSCIFGIPYATAWFITFIASFWLNVDTQIEILSGKMGLIVLTIIGFYFAGGSFESLVRKKAK